MKINIKIIIRLFLLLACLWVLKLTALAQSNFDPMNPLWEDVPDAQTEVWLNKSIEEWKVAFGNNVEEWNPVQMEFYKQVKVLSLYDDEKQRLIERNLHEWTDEYGSMEGWKVEHMLFYAAVQDLKSNYTIITNKNAQIIARNFDPLNPLWEDLSDQETEIWLQKDGDEWKAVFGENVEDWNPVQMEFYKQVKMLAMYEEDKTKWISKSFEDWQEQYGPMDNWSIMTMLFYAAIQDLKAGYNNPNVNNIAKVAKNSKFDVHNPLWEDLNSAERGKWLDKDITKWKQSFGTSVADWNPIQMEFYKQVQTFGLKNNENSKKEWVNKPIEEWIKEYGEMDKWQVEQMLFFSAVQDMKTAD